MQFRIPDDTEVKLFIVAITAFNLGVLCHHIYRPIFSQIDGSTKQDLGQKGKYNGDRNFQHVVEKAITNFETTENLTKYEEKKQPDIDYRAMFDERLWK